MSSIERTTDRACPVKPKWLRRFGLAAFLFFLIKGLLWLIVPAGLAAMAFTRGE